MQAWREPSWTQFDDLRGRLRQLSDPARVTLRLPGGLPHPILTLIDTPGVGSVLSHNTDRAMIADAEGCQSRMLRETRFALEELASESSGLAPVELETRGADPRVSSTSAWDGTR